MFLCVNKSASFKRKDECYLDLDGVKFGNINSISILNMNIRSLNVRVATRSGKVRKKLGFVKKSQEI